MKYFLTTCLLAASTLWFGSCTKEAPNDKIFIDFINNTGLDIENVTIDSEFVGLIPNKGQSGYILFEEMIKVDTKPVCRFVGLSGSDTLESPYYLRCGIGVTYAQLKPGFYSVAVTLSSGSTSKYFDLIFK
jgi:hypothetical protein